MQKLIPCTKPVWKAFSLFFLIIFLAQTSVVTGAASQPPTISSSSSSKPVETSAPDVVLSNQSLTDADAQYLLSVYQDTWNYLATFVDPTTGIPYDSNKRQPATSLSNVGLYLAATAIAYQTDLINKAEAVSRINAALTSLDKVEKWEGIPRVWFTARGLKPIHGTEEFSYSKHVSNLIGGLILVESTFDGQVAQNAQSFLNGINFSGMYNANNGWLNGGYNATTKSYAIGQPWGNWYYKYLASEARLISYYMIIAGLAPSSHLHSLTTPTQVENGEWFFVPGYETGGAYMHYMASLFVDERKMLMGQTQRNYTMAQIKRAKKIEAPVWGWSASLDTRGEYIPYGELKNEIVAPYASMMAMIHYPKEGVENLRKLEELGARPSSPIDIRSGSFVAFDSNQNVPRTWAMTGIEDVYFTNKQGTIDSFKNYVGTSKNPSVTHYNFEKLTKLLDHTGYLLYKKQTAESIVKEVIPATTINKTLSENLENPDALGELINLAAQTHLYIPCQIHFRSGERRYAACRYEEETLTPWALEHKNEIYFVNAWDEIQSFSDFIDSTQKRQLIREYDEKSLTELANTTHYNVTDRTGTLAAFHKNDEGTTTPWAILTPEDVLFENHQGNFEKFKPFITTPRESLSVSDFDRESLTKILDDQGHLLYMGENVDNKIEEIIPGTILHVALTESISKSKSISDLLDLASQGRFYQPCEVKLTDGKQFYMACFLDDQKIKAWPLSQKPETFFVNSNGNIEDYSPYIHPSRRGMNLENYQSEKFVEFAEKANYTFPSPKTVSPYTEKVISKTNLKSEIQSAVVDDQDLNELIALSSKTNLYHSAQIIFKEKQKMNLGFRDSIDWKNEKMTKYYLTPSQGMGFLALANVLYDGIVWKSFAKQPSIESGLATLMEADQNSPFYGSDTEELLCQRPNLNAPAL